MKFLSFTYQGTPHFGATSGDGRVVDLTTPGYAALEEEFENSAAFEWLSRNAVEHGFHLSYPRDNPHGIAYEPWHWCWKRHS